MAGLIIRNLYKTFNINNKEVNALSNINLTIEDGSFVTIVGKSGCGKTTLLRAICGLEKVTKGNMEFTKGSNEKNISKRVGIVFQEPRLMPWLTVEQNMAFPLLKSDDKEAVHDIVHKYLEMLGLENFKDAYPNQISGGMAQRVALGRTLCYDPEIILMDEPLGALDAFNRRKLQNEFINIFTENKKTIIFVTHDVEEAIYLGQKIVVFDKGSVRSEIPVSLDYYRDTTSLEFLKLREEILGLLLA
ncbi:ABC transporter ATP-binding protein [Clostridium magnum]|uniref:Aliphatic sulfonates import ATP-binding protein SsuB n=1 Tax=Clostridium magnum DSM 2767 TaxID=1121326 RepID=A0A162T131_9CLOT|nr:ABC transporter ATP-binding protein [Clostridium magnum]KZL92111.1 aliphatic sulfonates import ATP-binding protein SsuB [Clostridium magnum DSM 2767]SHH21954.1 sulfonate transport system ATP-binding protein [Clostridium magnum DSM 2767]